MIADPDSRIALYILGLSLVLSIIAVIVLEIKGEGSQAGYTLLSTIAGGCVGAIAMFVKREP